MGYESTTGCPGGQTVCWVPYGPTLPTSGSASASTPVTTAQTGGTLSGTAGTFSQIAAATARKNCVIQNTSTDYEYAYFGTTQTPSPTNSFAIPAGASQSCANGATVSSGEPIYLASKSIANAPYVLALN